MCNPLPELLDPFQSVALHSCFEGSIPLAHFERLGPMLLNTDGLVSYRLHFCRDAAGLSVISGTINTELILCCQRCNGKLSQPVHTNLSLALIESIDQCSLLPEHYDPVLIDDRLLHPGDLIEDELILSVPLIPRHTEGSCEISRPELLLHTELRSDHLGSHGDCIDTKVLNAASQREPDRQKPNRHKPDQDSTQIQHPFAKLIDLKRRT